MEVNRMIKYFSAKNCNQPANAKRKEYKSTKHFIDTFIFLDILILHLQNIDIF